MPLEVVDVLFLITQGMFQLSLENQVQLKLNLTLLTSPACKEKTVTLTTNTSKGKELINIKTFVLPKN